ncbi:PhzF family phenazine biosynthesis isomerase [Mesorhizobium sp. M0983]|uniref:PhzF family phenazine biosynthesis protein n=1 Tax=unclassified Mesorhizobium TaxID=325217 RepID=UPI003338D2CE
MPTLTMYQVDAFAEQAFQGNPAAVLLLEEWLPEQLMQAIANENNLAETAFVRANGKGWDLRWFTPVHEVDFCGHATLAAAHVLTTEYSGQGEMAFATRVGELRVSQREGAYQLDLPFFPPQPVEEELKSALQRYCLSGRLRASAISRTCLSSLPTRQACDLSFPICSGSDVFILSA